MLVHVKQTGMQTINLSGKTGVALERTMQAAGLKVLRPTSFVPGFFKRETLSEIKQKGFRFLVPEQ